MTSRPPRVAYCNCPRNLRKSSWLFVESISKWLPYLRTAAWWTLTKIYPQLRFTRHRILRPARIHLSHDFAYCGKRKHRFRGAGERKPAWCGCLPLALRSPRIPFVDPTLLQPHVLDADHASNETEPAHRLATLQSQTRVSDN